MAQGKLFGFVQRLFLVGFKTRFRSESKLVCLCVCVGLEGRHFSVEVKNLNKG